jgi:aspartate aminotransferase
VNLASRMSRISTESAFEVLVRARSLEGRGRDIIHLEIGEPDFATPRHIIEAAKQALDEGWTKYVPPQGLPELREAIAADVCRTRSIRVGAEHVCVVPGGKPMIFFPMLALAEPGDEVIYPNPGFPTYESMINFVGAAPVPVPLVEERGFSFDLDVLASSLSDRTKLVILNSPQNPTGGVIPADDVRIIADLLSERDVMVLSDEIYSRIWFGEPPLSIASVPGMLEKTIILDGFSKTYAMTGWRLGYGVMPPWMVDAVNKVMVNSNSCTASFTQRAGIAALCGPQDDVTTMVSRVSPPARRVLRRAESRALGPAAGCPRARSTHSRTLRRPGGNRKRWPMRCSMKPAWPRSAGPRSANTAKAICASAWPIHTRT